MTQVYAVVTQNVHRRIGGLENMQVLVVLRHMVHRRIGGLEMLVQIVLTFSFVHRRIGGLEKSAAGESEKVSSSPPNRRLRKLHTLNASCHCRSPPNRLFSG